MKRFRASDNKLKVYIIISVVLIFLSIFIYYINLLMSPAVITASDVETRAKVTEIINSVILNEYLAQFNYDNVVHVEKDKDGNIVMIKADTLKMNKIACDVALESQNQLKNIGEVGLKLPLGYILKNNLLAFFGPDITVKMKPVGYIETKYLSDFESAGINQTRHKIYVQVKTRMKIIIPFNSKDIEVKNEVPISETIIVGKVPETAINLGLDNAGYTLPNGK
ncbi:sporulation protein YunB [Clostridium sp. DJ247]|uniref:sporulation protein YunB n=1 Tax=Clostridium sp. DJ247 TaxID=2726188 RepID=UPI0028BEAE50|nr:sporulation protein YunB [Clostridium sp. DJ247]